MRMAMAYRNINITADPMMDRQIPENPNDSHIISVDVIDPNVAVQEQQKQQQQIANLTNLVQANQHLMERNQHQMRGMISLFHQGEQKLQQLCERQQGDQKKIAENEQVLNALRTDVHTIRREVSKLSRQVKTLLRQQTTTDSNVVEAVEVDESCLQNSDKSKVLTRSQRKNKCRRLNDDMFPVGCSIKILWNGSWVEGTILEYVRSGVKVGYTHENKHEVIPPEQVEERVKSFQNENQNQRRKRANNLQSSCRFCGQENHVRKNVCKACDKPNWK